MEEENKEQRLNIELTEDVAKGSYANLFVVTHSSSEFIFDFIQLMPGLPKAKVVDRIIMAPEHTKRFMLALQDYIDSYERNFGVINLYQNNNENLGQA